MSEACTSCGGALGPGADLPPCLCELTPVETLPAAIGLPETKGGGGEHARALRCPGCGAWLETGARRCAYCAIELAAVRCWRCFELSFAGCAHCAACGARLGLEADLGPTDARCPACEDEVLHLVEVGEHRIRECLACGGVLVAHGELESLTQRAELEAGARLEAGVRRSTLASLEVRYRGCPDCGAMLARRNFGVRSGVVVDVCREHGVWFDEDELTAVLAFVASGGLREQRERERAEAQRELARRRAEALAEQSKLARSTGGPDPVAIESAGALLSAIFELFR